MRLEPAAVTFGEGSFCWTPVLTSLGTALQRSRRLTFLLRVCDCSSVASPTSGRCSTGMRSGGPLTSGSCGMTVPVASCWTEISGRGGFLVSTTIEGSACALVLNAAAVSTSKIVVFNFRLLFLGGSGFFAGGTVTGCCIWLLGPAACDEAFTGIGLSLAPVGVE